MEELGLRLRTNQECLTYTVRNQLNAMLYLLIIVRLYVCCSMKDKNETVSVMVVAFFSYQKRNIH